MLDVRKTIMGIWYLRYFEAGAPTAYACETYYSLKAKDVAVARYLRLGGDDILKVTTPLKPNHFRRWLKRIWPI
jgi:hypothetical protein